MYISNYNYASDHVQCTLYIPHNDEKIRLKLPIGWKLYTTNQYKFNKCTQR